MACAHVGRPRTNEVRPTIGFRLLRVFRVIVETKWRDFEKFKTFVQQSNLNRRRKYFFVFSPLFNIMTRAKWRGNLHRQCVGDTRRSIQICRYYDFSEKNPHLKNEFRGTIRGTPVRSQSSRKSVAKYYQNVLGRSATSVNDPESLFGRNDL